MRGFEPPTPLLGGVCSIQLSYMDICKIIQLFSAFGLKPTYRLGGGRSIQLSYGAIYQKSAGQNRHFYCSRLLFFLITAAGKRAWRVFLSWPLSYSSLFSLRPVYKFSAIPGGMLHSTRTSMASHIRVRHNSKLSTFSRGSRRIS